MNIWTANPPTQLRALKLQLEHGQIFGMYRDQLTAGFTIKDAGDTHITAAQFLFVEGFDGIAKSVE